MAYPVNHPKHYQTESGLEAIEVIEAFFHNNAFLANAFKYLARAGKKDKTSQELNKSIWYIRRELKYIGHPPLDVVLLKEAEGVLKQGDLKKEDKAYWEGRLEALKELQ